MTWVLHPGGGAWYYLSLRDIIQTYDINIAQLWEPGSCKRMNINTPAMTRISMDMKQMPANREYSHILVLLCEVSNYMVALPLQSTRNQSILEAFQRGYLAYFGPPTHIICDQDPAFTSSLMEA